MTAYCKTAYARSSRLDQGATNEITIFWQKAAEFDELAVQASSPGLRDSYATVAQSYRRLVQFMEAHNPNGRQSQTD
jgi:hypothetical protein